VIGVSLGAIVTEDPDQNCTASRDLASLLAIMKALRTPVTGCPWDLEQNFASIAPYTIEEAYEVADAIQRGDLIDLKDELGDLLLQVVFHAQIAQEAGVFDFGDVVEAITAKLVRRHPHVFGDKRDLSPENVKRLWGAIKAAEKADRRLARLAAGLPEHSGSTGLLAAITTALPALTRAVKLQEKASTVGFDWNDARLVVAKLREELGEIEEALPEGDQAAVADEVGDLLFAAANLARHLKVDPEAALRGTNAKFERRFASIEAALGAIGRSVDDANLEEMDALWNAAKQDEKS
jgi:nucleoside triphosphate diphosphatase